MEKKLSDFTNQFQVSHTLKFELKPIGKTEENLKKSGLLEKDFKRAEDYPKVKEFLDEQHKQFLQKVLGNINDIDWQPLADQIEALQKTKSPQEKESLKKAQDDYRKKITEKFSNDDLYSILVKEPTPSKLFKQVLKNSPETSDEIKMFASFSCYFKLLSQFL